MKLEKKCPNCGSDDLGDRWTGPDRKLKQYCRDCGWKGKLRTPEQKKVSLSKKIYVSEFGGYTYNVYDRYGHISTISRSYNKEDDAIKEIKRELEHGRKPENPAGPYTAVLFPDFVTVAGKKFT